MDHLVDDLSCALEESKLKKNWRHSRRSRSTSNLLTVPGHTKSDTDENESDEAERSLAKLSLQCKSKRKVTSCQVVESDSFNELFNNGPIPKVSQSKRRRRYKRMAVDMENRLKEKKKLDIVFDAGKRKRIVKSFEESLIVCEDEEMKSDDNPSEISESDDSECCDNDGGEGDDEHSDWVGDEWLEETDENLLRRLREYAPSREIRAGRRRVHPTKSMFSIKTSANEQLSKFLQDPGQSEIRLHPMKKDERVQLSHLARLYSLRMHYMREDENLTCPILTKTTKTTQMDKGDEPANCRIENDLKRVKI